MKLKIEDLKKALQWIEANSRDVYVTIEKCHQDRNLILKCQDKYEVQVEIKLFNEGNMGPRITKEDAL